MANTTKKDSYRLITGEFTPDEAREVLMTLINDKIKFHQRNNLSRLERLGETGEAGEKRISELLKAKEDLLALIDEAKGAGTELTIDCNIEASLTQK